MKLIPRNTYPETPGIYFIVTNIDTGSSWWKMGTYNKGTVGVASFSNGEWRTLPEDLVIGAHLDFFWIQSA